MINISHLNPERIKLSIGTVWSPKKKISGGCSGDPLLIYHPRELKFARTNRYAQTIHRKYHASVFQIIPYGSNALPESFSLSPSELCWSFGLSARRWADVLAQKCVMNTKLSFFLSSFPEERSCPTHRVRTNRRVLWSRNDATSPPFRSTKRCNNSSWIIYIRLRVFIYIRMYGTRDWARFTQSSCPGGGKRSKERMRWLIAAKSTFCHTNVHLRWNVKLGKFYKNCEKVSCFLLIEAIIPVILKAGLENAKLLSYENSRWRYVMLCGNCRPWRKLLNPLWNY